MVEWSKGMHPFAELDVKDKIILLKVLLNYYNRLVLL
jgi:hypothetical protein